MALLLCLLYLAIFIVYANDKHQSIYYQQWCADNAKKVGYCTYLDDTGCNKYFPQTYDREFMCPNQFDESYLNGYKPTSSFNDIIVNTSIIKNLVNPNFYISVIMIRRNKTGYPFYKYFS